MSCVSKETTLNCLSDTINKLDRKQQKLTRRTRPKSRYSVKLSEEKRIRCSVEYSNWRKEVFKRDNYTCQQCKRHFVRLNAHHIISFAGVPALRLSLDNGLTLCSSCHYKFHKQYGKTNFPNLKKILEKKRENNNE